MAQKNTKSGDGSASKAKSVVAAVPAKKRAGHATRRPRADAPLPDEDTADGQFVASLARGLEVLSAFRAKEGPLGNQELAERTGLTKPTVSRLAHTLTRLGFLSYNPRQSTYELGGRALAFAYAAIASIDVAAAARPLMQALADDSSFNVGLGMPDRQAMVYTVTCEGKGPIHLALRPGSRVPIMTSAMGRAYLLGLEPHERDALLLDLQRHHGSEWDELLAKFDAAREEFRLHGFCTSLGDWHADIHGVAVPVAAPPGQRAFALNLGGPSYLLSRDRIFGELGPRLGDIAKQISTTLHLPARR